MIIGSWYRRHDTDDVFDLCNILEFEGDLLVLLAPIKEHYEENDNWLLIRERDFTKLISVGDEVYSNFIRLSEKEMREFLDSW